ncbi:MAG: hypothetical protein N2506_03150 [Dehalococcoidales bacterium]|nr:hypothetical protein [Dehalococcoidales bacterium]
MGSRDYVRREKKKPKKDAKKPLSVPITQPPVEVEVIRKGKKHKEEELEE